MEIDEAGRTLKRLSITERAIGSLKPFANNPRTHSQKQVRQIADSLKRFGWSNPVLIDDDNRIIAGHGRLAAARLLGMAAVPAISLGTMSEAERRAYIIADNRLAELAGWDEALLKVEFEFLLEAECDFSIETIGFDMADIDRIAGTEVDMPEEAVAPPDRSKPAVSEPGDL